MLLRQEIQRLTEEEEKKKLSFQTSMKLKPVAVGSIKLQKLNYDSGQQFFVKSDIPYSARLAKQEVKSSINPDVLGLKRRSWDMSVSAPRKFDGFQQNQQTMLFKIKKGFYDQKKKTLDRPNKIWTGTQTRDNYLNWNVSNANADNKQKKQNMNELTMNSLTNTVSFKEKIKDYTNPTERYHKSVEITKKRDDQEKALKESFRSKYIWKNPTDSQTRTNAKLYKMLDQHRRKQLSLQKYKNKDDIEMSIVIKPKLSTHQKAKIYKKYYHTGKYSKMIVDKEEQSSWSCCLNEDENNPGCAYKIVDGNKKNLASYNNN